MGHYVGHSETFDSTLDTPAYAEISQAPLDKFPPCAPDCTQMEIYTWFNLPDIAPTLGPYIHDYGTFMLVGAVSVVFGTVVAGTFGLVSKMK